MATRRPVVAGTFYPADARELAAQVRACLGVGGQGGARPFAVMAPHAGYAYSGRLAGLALAGAELAENLIILCPNHSGLGHPLGVWPDGAWLTPLGAVPVNGALAASLVKSGGGFALDTLSHAREHSIEVLLPFLQMLSVRPAAIVPVCVGTGDAARLEAAGRALGALLADPRWRGRISLLISSDMNHYEDLATTEAKDRLVLDRLAAGDAGGLLATVAAGRISMCGAAPAALALHAAGVFGGARGKILGHDTSASATGDAARVVGYAAAHFFADADSRRDAAAE